MFRLEKKTRNTSKAPEQNTISISKAYHLLLYNNSTGLSCERPEFKFLELSLPIWKSLTVSHE